MNTVYLNSMQPRGYFTIRLLGGHLHPPERVVRETAFAQALEHALGGAEAARDLVLEASTSTDARTRLSAGAGLAESLALPEPHPGLRFEIRAWTAMDL